MNLASVIALCGALLGFVLAAALRLARGRNRRANDILAIFALVFSLHLLFLAPLLNGHAFDRRLHPILLNDVFLFGPLLYFYVRAMTEPSFRLTRRDGWHLLPFALVLVFELAASGLNDNLFELLHRAGARGWPPSPGGVIALCFYGSFILYLAFSLRRLRAHGRWVADHFSWQEGINLRWLWLLISVSLALSLLGLLISVTRLFVDLSWLPRGGYSMLMMIALFHLIAFMAICQPAIFHAQTGPQPEPLDDVPIAAIAVEDEASVPATATPKYETSALDASLVQRHWQRLLAVMAEHRPHLNNELRLAQLAQLLELPPHHLSQVINQSAGQHFLEFIGGYRVEEAKRLLRDERYRDRKMVALAFDAGFNSQSAFYKQFKKLVGMTPQQFRVEPSMRLHPVTR